MKDLKDLKIAIVHDWLYGGGAERVVQELHNMFPEAPIYTSYCSDEWRHKLGDKVVTGWLQHFGGGLLRKFMVLGRIWWFGHLDLSGYDLVIVSSGNGEAKGVRVPKGTALVCYCHTPTHYYWRHYDHYLKHPGFGVFDPLARLGLKILVGPLRRWDYKAAQQPDFFAANSTHTQADIKKYYGRDSVVIFPPVNIDNFEKTSPSERAGFVTAGRQATYKRTDLIVQACNELELPLMVIGRGPDHRRLVKIAGPLVKFMANVSDEEMPKLLAGSEAFVFAAYEDFGVTPVEAMAAGTPVIAYRNGGALDYVESGATGEFFDEQTVESLKKALSNFKPAMYDSAKIKTSAKRFSAANFQTRFKDFISACVSR